MNNYFLKRKLVVIENYNEVEKNEIKTRIENLEGNTSENSKMDILENRLIVEMPDIGQNGPKRINCRIECYFSQNYKNPIIIDNPSINLIFEVYDFLLKCFRPGYIEV